MEITSQQIKDSLIKAQKDPAFGKALQQRLETGRFDTQLSELGFVRTPNGLAKSSDVAPKESFGRKVADVFTGSTQAFGKTAGEVLAAKKNTEDFSKAAKQSSDLELALVQKIADNKKIGQDTAKLESTLADLRASRPKLENFTGVEDITNKQVIGQAIGTALEATSGGLLEGGAKNVASKSASLLEKIKAGTKVGGAYGAAGGLSQGLQQNKDAMGIVGDVATGAAIGSALGGGLPAVGAVASQGTKLAGTQVGKLSKGASKIAGDIIPTKGEFMSGQISKALDLTAGDLSNIKLGTGNDVGDFIARNNLIGGSKEETIAAVKKLTDSQYKLVRDEIAKVPNVYSVKDIPKVKQSLSLLEKQVKDVPGLEDTYKQVKALSKKTSIELKDVQKVKELLDDQFSLFKMTGDVKEGTIKKGLANVRKNIKEFIETEVKNTTGADIAQLNNDVSTGKSIMKLAEKRSTRDFTRANVSLSDLGAFGGGSMIGTPLFGAAAVAVKRIAETPTARLYLAKLINSLPKATQKAVQEELLNGKVPKVIKDTISDYRLATNIKK